MPQAEHPTVAELRRLNQFRDLPDDELSTLATELEVLDAPIGTHLVRQGSESDETYYLLDGTLWLEAADGATKRISHDDRSARSPIARLRPRMYDVRSITPVRFLVVDNALFEDRNLSLPPGGMTTGKNGHRDEGESDDGFNEMARQIYEDLDTDRLLLPSLPDVAIRIGQVVNSEQSDARTIAAVVETDPAITAKLLKAANSPRYGGMVGIESLPTAISRLGLRNTHHLVITFALRELFRSQSPVLNRRMEALWTHSQQIAAICHVMASRLPGFDPEEALLAGLIHDIGELAVIGYAQDFPEVAQNPEILDNSITALRAQLGTLMLSRWKLPSSVANVPLVAENWLRDHAGPGDYGDLVILAQMHAFHDEEPTGTDLPEIRSTPAFAKLSPGAVIAESRLAILHEAERELSETSALLAG